MASLGLAGLAYGFVGLNGVGRIWVMGAGMVTALYYAGGRRLPAFKTPAIAIAWCGATLLPLARPDPLPEWLWAAAAHRFLLVAALALAYDIVDMAHDPDPTPARRLGRSLSEGLVYLLLFAVIAVAVGLPASFRGGLRLSAIATAAILFGALRSASAPWYARKAAIDAAMPLHWAVCAWLAD